MTLRETLSQFIDLPTIAFLTLAGIAIAGTPYPFLGSFAVGVAGAVVGLILLIIRLRGEKGWLIRQFVDGPKDEPPPSLVKRIWRNVKLTGILLIMAGLLGLMVNMACALPVVWWAATPFKQQAVFDYGAVPRGRYVLDDYHLHFRDAAQEEITLTWPYAVRPQVGAGRPLDKGTAVTLEGRTSWAGTVIDRIVVAAKRGTVVLNADGSVSPPPAK